MQPAFAGLIIAVHVFLLPGCGMLYEHKSDVPGLQNEVASTLAIGDSRQKVHSLLGEPLVDVPDLGLEVYRKSGRDYAVLWIIAPWVPLPAWGDKTIVVVMVVYDAQGMVEDISVGSWEETRYRYAYASVDAGGFSFLNTSRKGPATLLAPPVSSGELFATAAGDKTCSLIFVMGRCPMETIVLDGVKIADFPNSGQYCSVDDSGYSHAPNQSSHVLYGTLLWMQVKPGMHQISVGQRLRSDDFQVSFECRPGETVYAELRGRQYKPDSWHGRRLEAAINITRGTPDNPDELDGSRFILWHAGSWFGLPNGILDR